MDSNVHYLIYNVKSGEQVLDVDSKSLSDELVKDTNRK